MRQGRFDPAAEGVDPPVESAVPLATRRETNIRLRKQRILDSATKLISSEGISALTMRRLAAKARLDVTTLYNYYGSKEQILEALRRAGARRIQRQIEELGEQDPMARIRAIVLVTLGARESPPGLARPLNVDAPRRRPGEGPLAHAAKEALVPEIARAVEKKLLSPWIDAELLATSILEIFHPWLELWAAGVVEADEVEARVGYDLSLCLLAAATKGARARLEAELIESQRRLRAVVPAVGKASAEVSPGVRAPRRAGART